MRMLKQDKRRRGETIGKLLRCIDDMKEPNRAVAAGTDGAAVDSSTFSTAGRGSNTGWSTDDQVRAAIEALDIERGQFVEY